jgi:hypothetical protein
MRQQIMPGGSTKRAVAGYRNAVEILEPMTARDPINVLKRRALRTVASRRE